VSEDEHDTTGDMAGFQELSRIFAINRAAQAGSCDAFLTFPDCVFSEHTRVLSRLTSIYAEYGILLSTGINVYNDTTMAMENYCSR